MRLSHSLLILTYGGLAPSNQASRSRQVALARVWLATIDKRDVLALALIVAGYVIALLVMPIRHDFAMIDDWVYVRSAERVAAGQGFLPPEYAQATLITQSYWGALFGKLFGMSFTTLTASTVALSFVAVVAFYVLLRRVGFRPGLSGLGVALLALNPYFLNLSYTFMTEIPFLAFLLVTCLLYFEGMKSGRDGWLWLGSAFAALTFLTRQFGVAVPVAAVIWLVCARRFSWSRAAAVGLLPALAVAAYYLLTRGLEPSFVASVGREELLALVRSPSTWVKRAGHLFYLELFLPGLLVPLFVRLRHWKLVAGLSIVTALAVFALWQVKFALVDQGQSGLDELSYSWLQGLVRNPTLIYCIGAALTVWLLAGFVEAGWPGFVALVRRRREAQPVEFLYLVGAIIFAGTYIVSAGFLDRYWLPVLPFIIIPGLMLVKDRPIVGFVPVMAWLAVLALFGSLVHVDMYAAQAANWQAGRWLVSQGVPYDKIRAGYTWDGYYLYDEPARRLGNLDINVIGRVFPPDLVIDPEYVVDTAPKPGYHVLRSFPYVSRLGGTATHYALAMKRD